jgi:hypothetical protein
MNHITSIFVFTFLCLLCSRQPIASLFFTTQLRHWNLRHLPAKIQLFASVSNFSYEMVHYSLKSHSFPPSAGMTHSFSQEFGISDMRWRILFDPIYVAASNVTKVV